MGNCQADNQGRLLEYERFPFGSDLLGAIQRGKDIRYIIFSRQAPWDDKIKYGIFRRSRVGDSGIAARLPRSNTSNGNSGSGSGCSSGSRWPCRSGSPCWPARSSGSRRPGRGDVKRKVAINPQTMGNYKKIKSITLRMEPSGTTWAAFLRRQAGKEEIYQVEILLCFLCNKLKLRRYVNG